MGALHVPGKGIVGQSALDSHEIDVFSSHKPQFGATTGASVGDFDGLIDGDDVGSDVNIVGPFVFMMRCVRIRTYDVSTSCNL